MVARTLQHGLTAAQSRLVDRHRHGLVRLVKALCARRRCETREVIVLLAHKTSRIGEAVHEHLDLAAGNDALVMPGLARDLPAWIARLGLSGPIQDCTAGEHGVAVIVVDEQGEMALCRVYCGASAASARAQNRSETS